MNRASSNGAAPQGLTSGLVSVEERTVAEPEVRSGHVRVPRGLLRRLGLVEGQIVRVEYGERATLLRATVGVAPWAESNPEDLTGIGARSGSRLSYVVDKDSQPT